MSDSTRRAIRTGIDLTLGILASLAAILLVPGVQDQFEEWGLGGILGVFGIVVLVLTAFFNKLKNELEDIGIIPAVLKAPASEGENPIPDPEESPDYEDGEVEDLE